MTSEPPNYRNNFPVDHPEAFLGASLMFLTCIINIWNSQQVSRSVSSMDLALRLRASFQSFTRLPPVIRSIVFWPKRHMIHWTVTRNFFLLLGFSLKYQPHLLFQQLLLTQVSAHWGACRPTENNHGQWSFHWLGFYARHKNRLNNCNTSIWL